MLLERDLRRLIAEGERELPPGSSRNRFKEGLAPQYRLMLTALCQSQPVTIARVDDYLRIVSALREPDRLANLVTESAQPGDTSLEDLLLSPLRVLSAYLAPFPGTMLLVLEPGVDVLTFAAVRGGAESLEKRTCLACASSEFVEALTTLIQQHRADIRRFERREPTDETFYTGLERAGGAAWQTLPPKIQHFVAAADTIIYLASPFGDLSEFSLELIRDQAGWLGTRRAIARVSSFRTLIELLSPNRIPPSLTGQGFIVRGSDIADLDHAEAEIASVSTALREKGLRVAVKRKPNVKSVKQALDKGMRIVHFVGHAAAGSIGEALWLAPGEPLSPRDFSELGGAQTPFVFLNVCETGRVREAAAGASTGFSARLVEKGAPAVVAAFQPVPDRVALAMARAFYDAAGSQPVGLALARARAALEANPYPPASWGAYALFGDPNFAIIGAGPNLPQTRLLTESWPAHIGRFLATGAEASRARALALLASERERARKGEASDIDRIVAWVGCRPGRRTRRNDGDRLGLCESVAQRNLVAGCALRMLLAKDRLEDNPYEESETGMRCATAIHDTIAWTVFALAFAVAADGLVMPTVIRDLLDEAEGRLEGWVLSDPAVDPLLERVRDARAALVPHRD